MYYIIHDVRYNAKESTEYCILSYLKVLYNIIVTRLHTEFIMLEWILPFMNVHCTTIQYSDTVFYHWQMILSCISVHKKVKKICTVFIIHECILSLKKVLFINTVQFFCYSWKFFLLFMNYFIIHEFFSLFMIFLWFFFIIHEVTRIKSQCYHSCLYLITHEGTINTDFVSCIKVKWCSNNAVICVQ